MKNYLIHIKLLTLTVLLMWSCGLHDLDINEDPNNPAIAAPNLQLSQIQIDVMNNFAQNEDIAETFMGLMGTQAFSRYDLNNNVSFSVNMWNNIYAGPAKDLESLIAISADSPHYLGIAQVLKAYTYGTMVDLFGDIPYSQASQGDALDKIINPQFDDDGDIYTDVIRLLEEAVANFALPSAVAVGGDLIYSGNVANWTKCANSMLLKFLITSYKAMPDNATKIAALLAEDNFITGINDDFTFTFSADPTSIRHPWYTGAYTGGGFDNTYINNEFSVESLIDEDPRWPFQFRRQTSNILDENDPTERSTIPCISNGSCTYGYVVKNQTIIDRLYTDKGLDYGEAEMAFLAGVFGRDRGDGDGIPADGSLRLIPGVYPCGGFYDIAEPAIPPADAAAGGGIFPALTDVNVLYYKIEAALALGQAGDARAMLEAAIRSHIGKVVTFGLRADGNSVAPTLDDIDPYVQIWLDRYDAAPSDSAKLNVCMKQLWFSSFGNGFDLYNAFRRTGFPSQIQQHVSGTIRDFPLKWPYPQTELTLNPNAAAYIEVAFDATPVFWDVD